MCSVLGTSSLILSSQVPDCLSFYGKYHKFALTHGKRHRVPSVSWGGGGYLNCKPQARASSVSSLKPQAIEHAKPVPLSKPGIISILGVTIVTPTRNDRGRFRSPHANVLGRLIPNCLPKKPEMRPWVDQTNEAHHREIREVSLETRRREERGRSSGPDLFTFIILLVN